MRRLSVWVYLSLHLGVITLLPVDTPSKLQQSFLRHPLLRNLASPYSRGYLYFDCKGRVSVHLSGS